MNTCQRLEQLGKELADAEHVTILVSADTAGADNESFRLDSVGQFELRGKREHRRLSARSRLVGPADVDIIRPNRPGVRAWEFASEGLNDGTNRDNAVSG